ncbi:uncharacterized protein TRUGW13939_00363 [Talaromyces rugulosus]|uniref:Uncharacterized protein n=1 Tax=Talaromyces rugulosus TaxID=121627 RepID=A0A7H8QIM3_TALRU|nr:uncharacterized protein TRUGW13939_00363 [Talaromyces rugulosus]QKX53285.1 hypothetical protein TRUGW13939_00363 [Talaromyces rugulosus]
MTDISSIREMVFKENAKRIVMKMKTRCLNPDDYANSAKTILNDIFPNWESDNRILFLAVEVFEERAFMAFDINHHDYDFRTAHQDKSPLPVYVLKRVHKGRNWDLIRLPRDDTIICTRLAELHRAHGYDVELPIVEDHTSVIVHANPRSPV